MRPRALGEPAAHIASPAERGGSAKPPVRESGSVVLLWGWSRVDGRAHAVDPNAEHPALVYVAQCGHRVLRRSGLFDVLRGPRCPVCIEGTGR
jgi:hypothetical protein